MREARYDVVVIGSGAGGGTLAKELAPLVAAGRRVALLEWGARLRARDFTGRELEMARRLYFDDGGFLTADGTMTLAFGRALGGSTVVYTGTSLVVTEQTIERWAVPGLEWADVERRSRGFIEENNVHLLGEEAINDNNRLFRQGCERLGWRVRQFPINVKGCRGAGLCNLGCPNGAKQGTHVVQIPAAEAAGVEVITNCRVERIGERELIATVENPAHGEPSCWESGQWRVRAKAIVVAGGAVQSPALLLRSGFGARLPALGRYFTAHPALILVGEHARPISNYFGHPKSYYCDEFTASDRFLLETCMYFPFTTAKNLIGFGEEHAALITHMDRLQMILVLALDPALPDNRIGLDRDGQPVVHYRFSEPVLDALLASMRASARIFFAAGATRVHAPAAARFFITADEASRVDELITRRHLKLGRMSVTSAHPMGGCRMGKSAADSVTDAWGAVHGVPWLFVGDASLFPRCSEVNPYLTVMALASRTAERVRERIGELSA